MRTKPRRWWALRGSGDGGTWVRPCGAEGRNLVLPQYPHICYLPTGHAPALHRCRDGVEW